MKGNNKKAELLEIAYKLFIVKGYDNTSVDEIISEAGIAKGTYYYYFESKEKMLEEVINMMISKEIECATQVLNSDMPLENKLVGIIASMRPNIEELKVKEVLNKPENIVMHQKINEKIIEATTPLLSEVIENGVKSGIFDCENVRERVKLILIMSNELFDEEKATKEVIQVFIDTVEKILGAKKGTMAFIEKLIIKE